MAWVEGVRAFATGRALIGAVLLGTLAAAATAQEVVPEAGTQASLPPWLVVDEPLPPKGIARAWKAVSRDIIPYPRDDRPTPYGTPSPPFTELQAGQGEFAGHWRFHASRGRKPAHAAWRLMVSDDAPYRVTAQLYCDEASGDCEPLRRELAWVQAPRPDNEAAGAEWLEIITAGPCEPGPSRMAAPDFPPKALREAVSGTVRVRVAFNACGEVRHASVFESSGNRELDRAAVRAARAWRLALPEGHTGPGQGVVPIRFAVESEFTPPD